MKKFFVLTAIVVAIFGVYWYADISRITPAEKVELRGEFVKIAIADTESLRAQGLSGISKLGPDEGMLFIFPRDGKYAFWMKDMRFSIDILWLSSEGVVVDMVERVSPSTYPDSFIPETPARYVLELPEGYVEAHGVKVGDIVRL